MRVASSGYQMIAAFLAVVVAGFGLLAVDVWAEESLAKFEARVEAALAAAESALALEEARLDELAARNSRRVLANGRPSVAQAAANARLWERRIQELEAGEQTSRGELNGVLGSLGPDIAALAQRLSARHEQVEREKAEREKQERERAEQEQRAREKAERERAEREHTGGSMNLTPYLKRAKAERDRVEREKAERERAVGRVFRDCPECPEMVVVPAGSYWMGSPSSESGRSDDEGPKRWVSISEPFAVSVYEVTRGEFGRFVSATGRAIGNSCWIWEDYWIWKDRWVYRSGRDWQNPGFEQTDRHPVVCVSWEDARAYARWLSRETGHRYRLLSESAWEYVARAGTTGPFHTGATISTDQANYDGNYTYGPGHKGVYREHTVPVGSFPPNAFGLHDAHGNVREWVQDCWNDSYRGAPMDGRAWERGECGRRVTRGGSWFDGPKSLRSASRLRYYAGHGVNSLGFRLSRTLTP